MKIDTKQKTQISLFGRLFHMELQRKMPWICNVEKHFGLRQNFQERNSEVKFYTIKPTRLTFGGI